MHFTLVYGYRLFKKRWHQFLPKLLESLSIIPLVGHCRTDLQLLFSVFVHETRKGGASTLEVSRAVPLDFLTSELRSPRRNPYVGDPACGSLHIKKRQRETPASNPDALGPVTQGVSVLQPILAGGSPNKDGGVHLSSSCPVGFRELSCSLNSAWIRGPCLCPWAAGIRTAQRTLEKLWRM